MTGIFAVSSAVIPDLIDEEAAAGHVTIFACRGCPLVTWPLSKQVMAEMAADPDIRRENAALAREFAPAGNNGLGGAQAIWALACLRWPTSRAKLGQESSRALRGYLDGTDGPTTCAPPSPLPVLQGRLLPLQNRTSKALITNAFKSAPPI